MQQELHKGKNHDDVADALSDVGITYDNFGKYDQALECLKQALEMQQRLHEGENHIAVATVLFNVGLTYQRFGKYDQALEYLKQALEMSQQLLPDFSSYKLIQKIHRIMALCNPE